MVYRCSIHLHQNTNAEDPDIFGAEYNITSVSVLHEISWVEGDDEIAEIIRLSED